MTKNIIKYEGAFDKTARDIANNNFADVSLCTTQFLADSGSTGATLTNVVGMVTDVLTPGTYSVDINLITTATTNSGVKLGLKFGTASMLTSVAFSVTGKSASALAVTTFTTATDAASIIAATSAYVNVQVTGTLVVAASGTLQLQAAQNASHADDTTVEVGSYMKFTRIGN